MSSKNNQKKKTFLVTGATGLIGSDLIKEISKFPFVKIHLIVRKQSIEKAKLIFSSEIKKDIVFLHEGDLTKKKFLPETIPINHITDFIHAAALYDLESKIEDLYIQNVLATNNIIDEIQHFSQLEYFHYLSTYAVQQGNGKRYFEDQLELTGPKFPYEWSKFKAEEILRNKSKMLSKKIKIRIYRPGVVIGNFSEDSLPRIDGPFYLLKAVFENNTLKKILTLFAKSPIPFAYKKKASVPLIAITSLIKALEKIILYPVTLEKQSENQIITYHLTPENPVSILFFLKRTLSSVTNYNKINLLPVSKKFFSPLFRILNIPIVLQDYFHSTDQYDITNLKSHYPEVIALLHFSEQKVEKLIRFSKKQYCKQF